MTWPFCSSCGTILDPPEDDYVKCTYCSYRCKYSDMKVDDIVTKSYINSKPEWVKDIEDNNNTSDVNDIPDSAKHATIEEPCPKCNHPELYFYTMQLRSVDEGSTVFYECPQCKYKFSVNN